MTGPLQGLRVVEMAGIGPVPFAGMVLSDMGADVVRIDRPPSHGPKQFPGGLMDRGRRSVAVDLKHADGPEVVLRLVEHADAIIEGFRPGVMERLGLGPDVCHQRNPRLVYGRMTGFGQSGPMAQGAGHDINYIALGGALGMIGRVDQPPTPPLNLLGDFGGGAMFLCFGVVCGIVQARTSGQGQVVDAAMIDGTALLMAPFFGGRHGAWGPRGTNILDSGAPFYDVYETADGEWVAVGAIEPQFYAEVVHRLGLDGEELPGQMDREQWPKMKARFAEVFRSKTRAEWCELMEGTDACFAPVLSLEEVDAHPHNVERSMFVKNGGTVQPAPAPRFDRTPGEAGRPGPEPGEHTSEVLAEWGFEAAEVETLLSSAVISGMLGG